VFLMHNQESLGAPQISAPVQGTAAAVGVLADRGLVDLVNAGAPQSTITVRMEWNASGDEPKLDINPATLPLARYRTLAFRMGQSTEVLNPAGQDHDLTLEISSGSRTAAVPVGSLHRCCIQTLSSAERSSCNQFDSRYDTSYASESSHAIYGPSRSSSTDDQPE
jgi:hypothetical protein